jgi:hypothetical protein
VRGIKYDRGLERSWAVIGSSCENLVASEPSNLNFGGVEESLTEKKGFEARLRETVRKFCQACRVLWDQEMASRLATQRSVPHREVCVLTGGRLIEGRERLLQLSGTFQDAVEFSSESETWRLNCSWAFKFSQSVIPYISSHLIESGRLVG